MAATLEHQAGRRPASGPDPEESVDALLHDLGARRNGLGAREAERRLRQYGPNEIRRLERPSRVRELARELVDPLALLLWMAAGFSLVQGAVSIALTIVAVILLNAGFSFAQEQRAERATEALRAFLPPRVRVRREGAVAELDATQLVPGDIVLISEGDRVSADARLVDGSVELDMSPLTGESQPVARSSERTGPAPTILEGEDLVFAGTLCTGGEAAGLVYATGMSTQLGRIAALSQTVKTELSPLQVQVNKAAKLIAVIGLATGVVFFAIGTLVAGLPLGDALNFAIGLLVANVPEGLLPTITLALAVGARRMARRRALVKRLASVETLGSTDVICTDKTGTLTEGRMSVRRWWTVAGERAPGGGLSDRLAAAEPWSGLLQTAVRCSNASARRAASGWEQSGDPTESALLVAAALNGADLEHLLGERDARRRRLLHFDARLKRMTTLDEEADGSLWWHTKGAPLELLERCSAIRTADGDRPLSTADRDRVRAVFQAYAGDGLRVLGFAERLADPGAHDLPRDEAERDLTWLGLAALEDPPRAGVAEAVRRCRQAGLRIIVITGDHGATAEAIARQVGIVTGQPTVVNGPELEQLPDPQLDALLRDAPELVVARSTPETKLRIVDSLRHEGHIVAMTGDGVNDAPALRRADIGIAMGASGTDVAREAATMVLTDDSFSSIAAAVEEGRVVYDNLRKFITYVFAHLTPEVVPFLVFALAGGAVPLPLVALQILAIDLGTETLPALALGREPAEPDVMRRPPRRPGSRLIDRAILTRAYLWLGLVEAILVTAGFFWVLTRGGWSWGRPTGEGTPLHHTYITATTMTFAGIVACQVGAGLATRTTRASLREIGIFTNRLLLYGIAFEVAFAAALVYLPPLQAVFHTAPLNAPDIAILGTFAVIVWATDELRRWRIRRRSDTPLLEGQLTVPAAGVHRAPGATTRDRTRGLPSESAPVPEQARSNEHHRTDRTSG
jgi:calcium-translocating P-type ATPase